MHEGRIAITSPGPGKGTEVEIRLPIAAVQAAEAIAAEPSTAGGRRSLRVLIVEDNLDAAEMLELAVSQLGHVTRVAHDGATAITMATQFAPDVVLLDIGLPVMNGYAVVRTLRERPEFTMSISPPSRDGGRKRIVGKHEKLDSTVTSQSLSLRRRCRICLSDRTACAVGARPARRERPAGIWDPCSESPTAPRQVPDQLTVHRYMSSALQMGGCQRSLRRAALVASSR